MVLTCAVQDSESTAVLADERTLDPSAIDLPPFEVLRGRRVSDLRGRERRFFQYEYALRLIDDSLFGKDVKLPAVPIAYRIQTRLVNGAISEGLERTYTMPAQSVRILSLVSDDASDIRDASAGTFAALETAALRANVLTTAGGVLMGLAAILTLVGLVQVAAKPRVQAPSGVRPLPPRAILRGVDRELNHVRRQRETDGWTPELAGRTLAALRIAADSALARPSNQRRAEPDVEETDGALLLNAAFGGTSVLVSGSATARHVVRAMARLTAKKRGTVEGMQRLDDLQQSLTCLTQARYSREDLKERSEHRRAAEGREVQVAGVGPRDDLENDLDQSLASGQHLVRHLLRQQIWLNRSFRSVKTRASRLRRRLWIR